MIIARKARVDEVRRLMRTFRVVTLTIVHAGKHTFPLERRVRAVAFRELLREIGRVV